MVAVSPGRAPMTIPSSVAQATLKRDMGVRKWVTPCPRSARPSSMIRTVHSIASRAGSGQTDQEELLEGVADGHPDHDRLDEGGEMDADEKRTGSHRAMLEERDEREHEHGRANV